MLQCYGMTLERIMGLLVNYQTLAYIEGIIFDIQRYSLHDGPGLRTNIFLKGCGLSCWWCSNPESQLPNPEIAFFEKDCFYCGECVSACPVGAIGLEKQNLAWNTALCEQCGACTEICPSRAFRMVGRHVMAGEVLEEVLRRIA